MKMLRGILFACALGLAMPLSLTASAKPKASQNAKTKGKARPATARGGKSGKPSVADTMRGQLNSLKRSYRLGEINRRTMWDKLSTLHDHGHKMRVEDRVSLLQTQATMLMDANYPILASIYASQAIKIAKNPRAKDVAPSWSILRRVSEQQPIQSVLEILADSVDLRGKTAPVFGTDWNYFAGNAAARKQDHAKALGYYNNLRIADRYFFPAKYQQAMIHVDQGKLNDAEVALKAIVYPMTQNISPLREPVRKVMADYAYTALGRIYYERERFLDSAKMYRSVNRDGANFYDALFEQAWAFFMGGYPMHALGALHGAESPFYADVFNPEAPLLRSIIYYWLCRYEDSRNALADFMEKYGPAVEQLEAYLDRQRLDSETAYQLFENMISGVSGASLGLPESILRTAAEKDSMLLVRDQFAAIVEEKARLEAKGIFGSRKSVAKPLEYLDRWGTALRKDVGSRFLAELRDMKREYDRLFAQAQFLYVELLMSEKDQLLGKELHASSKITKVEKKFKVAGWGNKTQSWKGSQHGEYWWDEIGFHIVPVEPMCNVSSGSTR